MAGALIESTRKVHMFTKVALSAALALIAVAPANAVTIVSLYSTGVDASGATTTGNGADLHWALGAGPSYTGATNTAFPIPPWLAETSTSRWVTPTTDAANLYDAVDNTYTFTETFSLSGYDATTAAFSGRFADDNSVDSITLNGTTLAASGGGYTDWTSFDSTGGSFNADVNTLTFVVRNFGTYDNSQNPAGLRVEVIGTADAVPEASVWTLMIAGFAMVGFAVRHRSTALAAV